MRRGVRIGLIVTAGFVAAVVVAAVAVFALIAVPAWILLARGTTFDKRPGTPPLASISLTQQHGETTEIHARLARGYRLVDCVNLRIFDGFNPSGPREQDVRRLGPPTGHWRAPQPKAPAAQGMFGSWGADQLAPYYDRPEGRVTLRPYMSRGFLRAIPVAFPTECSPEFLFPDERLRKQIVAVLPTKGVASLNIHDGDDGWGGFIVSLDSARCYDIWLGWRDAEADRLTRSVD